MRRLADDTLIGASSTVVGGAGWAMDWYAAGAPAKAGEAELLPDTFQLLVAKPDGSVYYAKDHGALTGPLEGPFFATGSGEDYALGAMAAGCDAVTAVRHTCSLDVWSDLPLYACSHDGKMPKLYVPLPPDQFRWLP